jgi:hypothetical protein
LLQGDGRQTPLWNPDAPDTSTTQENKKLGATQ